MWGSSQRKWGQKNDITCEHPKENIQWYKKAENSEHYKNAHKLYKQLEI